VSGDRVVLAEGQSANTERLVRVAAQLEMAPLGPHVLVGGLAVMSRLAAVHRATQDIDTVIETSVEEAVEVIAAGVGERDPQRTSRAIIDGIKVDLIETGPFTADDIAGMPDADRIFLIAHRWALDTSTTIEIVAGQAVAELQVASPAALIGGKVSALVGRRGGEAHKRGSDIYDLYRLVVAYDRQGALGNAVATAPFGFPALVGKQLAALVADAQRAVLAMQSGGIRRGEVTPDDLRDAIGPLADRLR
jgi:hypothetical protein